MDISVITEFAIVFLLASVKFAVAVGYVLLPTSNFTYAEMIETLVAGGSFGIIVFYYFSNWINKQINKLFNRKKKKKKKLSTKSTRRFINIKNKYGLIGISLLTPVVLSIPVGSFLASRFYSKKKYTIWIMIAGVVFWAILLPLIKLYY